MQALLDYCSVQSNLPRDVVHTGTEAGTGAGIGVPLAVDLSIPVAVDIESPAAVVSR